MVLVCRAVRVKRWRWDRTLDLTHCFFEYFKKGEGAENRASQAVLRGTGRFGLFNHLVDHCPIGAPRWSALAASSQSLKSRTGLRRIAPAPNNA